MGLLDSLFQYNPDDGGPVGQQAYGFNDYTGDVPTKRAVDAWDEDPKLKKLREENPLGPDERGPNPLVEQLKRNFQNFSNAKPPAPGDTSYAPPITWKDPYGKGAVPVPGLLGPEMGGPFGAVQSAPPGPTDAAPLVTPDRQPVAAAASPAPAAGQPSSMLSKGPMGAPQSFTPPPGDVTSPPAAQPTQGQGHLPGVPSVPSGAHGGSPAENAIDLTHAGPGMLSKIWQGLQDNSGLLMGMGAGMLGAPSWATGLSRGFAGAAAGNAQDQRYNLQAASQNSLVRSLYSAMVAAKIDPHQALLQATAAGGNPELAKRLTDEYLVSRKADIKSLKSKDGWGNETERLIAVDPYTHETTDVTPGGIAADGAAASSATFAPGVTAQNFDHTKVGDDYLAQYSPEMQAWVKNYLAGMGMPTGRQAATQMVKAAAMKYGQDIGMPADDASIGQRKIWANSLGNTQSGVGLQAKGFQQGLEHFVKLSDNLVKMRLSNGMGLEPVAGWINGARNLTTDQSELVRKNDVIGQALSREMGNLFAKNGGGVHEAAETKKNVSSATMSSKSAAGALEAIDELMQGGLKTLEQRRDELFPNGNAPRGSNFMGPEQQKALEHIRHNIAILKGEQPADAAPVAAPAAAAPQIPPGSRVKMDANGNVISVSTP